MQITRRQALAFAPAFTLLASTDRSQKRMSQISKQPWGNLPSGEHIDLYTLRNDHGIETSISNVGGRIVTLKVPDRTGQFADVVLGYDTLAPYVDKNPFFGTLVGRYANRIANGEFKLNGHTYKLVKNNGPNSLHGGAKGFDKMAWHAEEVHLPHAVGLKLTYLSKDGEEGYPGDLSVTVTYLLSGDNALSLDYEAKTDKTTVLNLTNHSYFNLAGHANGNILDHLVEINADKFTPGDENLIPTGELRPVAGTPFDFREAKPIGNGIDAKDEQIQVAKGYDHNFVLRGTGELASAAHITEPHSGRTMEVLTTQPGMQFYTGNHLEGEIKGKDGAIYRFRSGFCFETQHFPDSPNQPAFPSTKLEPGERYHQTTVFKFGTDGAKS